VGFQPTISSGGKWWVKNPPYTCRILLKATGPPFDSVLTSRTYDTRELEATIGRHLSPPPRS